MVLPLFTMRVVGRSMLPMFSPRDIVVVNRLAYSFRSPIRGDIVVVRHPTTNSLLLKRVIALPESTLQLDKNMFVVDGVPHKKYMPDSTRSTECYACYVPKDRYFVAGDNLYSSTDSRHFGVVAKTHIMGKVVKHFAHSSYV